MAAVPPVTGARLWDESTQGSDHTMAPGQNPLIVGGPEGVVYAPPGWMCHNELGVQYSKTTDVSLKTGWVAQT